MTETDCAAIRAALHALAAAIPAGPAPVVLDPTPTAEPELDQTALADALAELVVPAVTAVVNRLVVAWLKAQGLSLRCHLEPPEPGPAGWVTAAALDRLDLHNDLVDAIGQLEFQRCEPSPRLRIY